MRLRLVKHDLACNLDLDLNSKLDKMIKIIDLVKIVKFACGINFLDLLSAPDFTFQRPTITESRVISSWFTLVLFRISKLILITNKTEMKKKPCPVVEITPRR